MGGGSPSPYGNVIDSRQNKTTIAKVKGRDIFPRQNSSQEDRSSFRSFRRLAAAAANNNTLLTSLNELFQRFCHDALLDLPGPVHDFVGPPVVDLEHGHQVVRVAGLDRLRTGQTGPGRKKGRKKKKI